MLNVNSSIIDKIWRLEQDYKCSLPNGKYINVNHLCIFRGTMFPPTYGSRTRFGFLGF